MSTDDTTMTEETITFHIKASDAKYTMSLPLATTTVSQLKEKLAQPEYANMPPSQLRLIYSGRVLKDPDTLATYNIKEGMTMHLVKSAASNQRQNPASSATTSSPSQQSTNVPNNLATGPGNNPLAGLTGARYAGFAQLPGAGMFGPDGGMGPPPSQEDMINMLSNPQFASQMNEALQNPQVIDMVIQSNPQLRAMGPQARALLQSDQFRRMITDPQMLRSWGEMQNAMGMGVPGQEGNASFPMPGVTNTTPGSEGSQTESNTQGNTSGTTQPNAPSLGDAAGGMNAGNPFAALFNPAFQTGTPPSTEGTGNQQPGSNPQNPFSFLFNPALMGQQQQPTEGGGNGSSPPPQTNPFQNNPLFNNPAAMNSLLQAFGGGGGMNTNPTGSNPLQDLFGGLGGMGSPPAPADNRPPAERFSEQLRQLNDMGFFDFDRNIQALTRSGGHVGGAVEWLLGQP